MIATACASAQASGIYGTLANFDVYNTTPNPCEGFEIELEGVHSSDLYRTFPAHYAIEDVAEYSDSTGSGVRIKYYDYYFRDSSGVDHYSVAPNLNPQSTNGHLAVNMVDVEHFGFSLRGAQPTATRTYWLDKQSDGSYQRANSSPLPVPTPTWSYSPPAVPGGAPVVRAEIQVPEPAEVVAQKADSIWMKVFKTEIEREVELDELMSGPGIVPQDVGELEIEWELLEGGKMKMKEVEVNEDGHAVVRRYEYFVYTGPYDVEHEPTTPFLEDDTLDPVELGQVGNFIAANMVAANLIAVPEPSTFALLTIGAAVLGLARQRRRKSQYIAG
ncbi:MAG: PEP-CTERM sorting domain-containing protein [Pirellulales bacterium]